MPFNRDDIAVTTNKATQVTGTSAILHGRLDDDGHWRDNPDFQDEFGNPILTNFFCWFDWGTTTSYGNNTPDIYGKITGDYFSATITGLTPSTVYHFRACADVGR